jgi:cyanophycinase-like exopeptidase
MDALFAAALAAAGGGTPRIVIVPTAAARQRPDLAALHGERAFRAAADRAATPVDVDVARILGRADAEDHGACDLLAAAHLVHLPGGDPDLLPAVLRGSSAWTAILEASARGACIAGASAGAMALGERLWTPAGVMTGLGLVPGLAVLPHYRPGRLAAWRAVVDGAGRSCTWLGLDDRTLVIGRPGGTWTVAGAGRAHVIPAGRSSPTASAGHGATAPLP